MVANLIERRTYNEKGDEALEIVTAPSRKFGKKQVQVCPVLWKKVVFPCLGNI